MRSSRMRCAKSASVASISNVWVGRDVLIDAEAAAEQQRRDRAAAGVRACCELGEHVEIRSVRRPIENLRTHVRVQRAQRNVRVRIENVERTLEIAGRDPELRVLAAGAHEIVRLNFDAGVEAQSD